MLYHNNFHVPSSAEFNVEEENEVGGEDEEGCISDPKDTRSLMAISISSSVDLVDEMTRRSAFRRSMNDDVVPSAEIFVDVGAETTLAVAICGLHIIIPSSDDVEVLIAEVRRYRRERIIVDTVSSSPAALPPAALLTQQQRLWLSRLCDGIEDDDDDT